MVKLSFMSGIVCTCIFAIATSSGAMAQENPAPTGNAEAVAIVEAGLRALGDEDVLNSIRNLRIHGVGTRNWRGQGNSPADPISRMPQEVDVLLDFEGRRVFQKQITYQHQEPYFAFNTVFTETYGFNHETVAGIHMPLSPDNARAALERRLRTYPEPRGQLLQALNNQDSLTYSGEEQYRGTNHRVVTYSVGNRGSLSLLFDSHTQLLHLLRQNRPTEMILGTAAFEERYEDYREVGGIMIPHHVERTSPNGRTVGRIIHDVLDYDSVAVNVPIDDGLFAEPEAPFERVPDTAATMSHIGSNIWFVENSRPNYNQLVVEFDEYLLVVDAPFNGELAESIIALIRETIPDKTIRYIVGTHFHYDHIGGLPAYVAEGATVVTTPGNSSLMDELISGTFEMGNIDRDASWDKEIVTDKLTISDGNQVVELYKIRPTPHVDEMLIAYMPLQKTLYVADVFSADWGRVRPAIPETRSFAQALHALDLDVEIILPGHGSRATINDLILALATGIPVAQTSR